MTPERAKELIPILKHIANGGSEDDIEEQYRDKGWRPFDGALSAHDHAYSYRFKPNPLELWVNVYHNRSYGHISPKSASKYLRKGGRTVLMREVV
jgi:hypothetical protein